MNYETLTKKKKELDSLRPFPSVLEKNLHEWFRIELTYTSNAIEGNTLTKRETAMVVEKGITVGGKTLREHLEATNHAKAFDFMCEKLIGKKLSEITEDDILAIHQTILAGIDDENAGRYRTVPVRISGSDVVMPNYRKVPDLMAEFMRWLNAKHTEHPVKLAGEAHYRFVTIHPFADGNGRTARLLMNLVLTMHGYPPAVIEKEERSAYISAIEKAQLGGSITDFESIIFKAADRSLDIYIKDGKDVAK